MDLWRIHLWGPGSVIIWAETCEEFHQQTAEQQRPPSGLIKVWSYLIWSSQLCLFKNPCEHFCFKNLSDFLGPCFLLSDLKASGSQTGLHDLWPLRRLQQNLKYDSENRTMFSYISQRESVLFSRALIVWMLLLHRDVTADLFPAWKSEFLNVFWNLNDHKCRSWRCVGWCFLFFSLSVQLSSLQF